MSYSQTTEHSDMGNNGSLTQMNEDAEKKLRLAEEYLFGDIYTRDAFTAVDILLELSKEGVAKAKNYLGDCYCDGNGVDEIDEDLAFSFYREAADQGLVEAEYNMSYCFEQGIGTQKNPKEAFKWMKKAAFHELSIAQLNLAYYYKNGYGTPVDKKRAEIWGTIAANNPIDPKVEGSTLSMFLMMERKNLKLVDYKTGEDLKCDTMSNHYEQKQWVNGEKLHLHVDEEKYKKLFQKIKAVDSI